MHEDIFWFDIPVDDVTVVHKLDGVAHLFENIASFFFWESSLFLKIAVDVATAAQLEDEVEIFLISEVRVELDDVRMVQKTLDFYLPNQLINELLLTFENSFGNFFECAYEVGWAVSAY